MLINKGSVMHIGHNNIHGNYSMSNQHLSTADEQGDQEVFISRWAETNAEKLLKNNQHNSGTHRPQLHVLKNKDNPPTKQIPSSTSRICSAILDPTLKKRY